MSVRVLTGWYVSDPQTLQQYVAIVIIGLTSVQRITTPLTVTNFPICAALTFRMGTAFWLFKSAK